MIAPFTGVRSPGRAFRRLLLYATVLGVCLVVLFPVYWMLVTSVRPTRFTITYPPAFFPEEIRWAERVIEAFRSAPGRGAVQLDGRMLDMPHMRQAERIPGMATRSQRCIVAFVDILDGLAELVEGGAETADILESVYARTGYTAELEASDDPQDGSRLDNLAELVTVAAFAG